MLVLKKSGEQYRVAFCPFWRPILYIVDVMQEQFVDVRFPASSSGIRLGFKGKCLDDTHIYIQVGNTQKENLPVLLISLTRLTSLIK